MTNIKNLISKKDIAGIVKFIKENNLSIDENKIIAKVNSSIEECRKKYEFFDRAQLIKKILLNSLYGSVGNKHSVWFDERIAQSTTLSGRCIVRHMSSKINELITGEYSHLGKAIIYGDSVTGDTVIRTDDGDMTIADLYDRCIEHFTAQGKEYGSMCQYRVMGFNAYEMQPVINQVEYVMRHQTSKNLFKITTENNKQITVTADHSVMVDRNGFLLEVKPVDIEPTDVMITLDDNQDVDYTTVKSVQDMGIVHDYVYDLSIRDGDHVFFGNDILVKNTDSCAADSLIQTNAGSQTIEQLFLNGNLFWNEGSKEYSRNDSIKVTGYDQESETATETGYNYVYRHKTNKKRFRITTKSGKSVVVTEDHSVMVLENQRLVEKKPAELTKDDIVICI
jgi:DNA polymerase family B